MIQNRSLGELLRTRQGTSATTLGAFVFSNDSNISSIYGAAGFDFVVIDTEHGLNDVQSVQAHTRACHAAGITAIVRLGVANFPDAPRLLDSGVDGFMLPHCGLAGYGVESVLDSMRYFPKGNRPTCTGVPAARFGIGSFAEYAERANRDVLSIGLIEDASVVDNLDAVLDSSGVDWLMPGPGDLAASMGKHGQLTHPDVIAAVDKIVAGAVARNTPVGMYVNDSAEIQTWSGREIDFFVHAIDYKTLARHLHDVERACRRIHDVAHAAHA
ncbi:staphyloferrin B biosynthesis citrate synthase SbnG [soil metagenome]